MRLRYSLLLALLAVLPLHAANARLDDDFSIENTKRHLRVIASAPHPVGSRAHDTVEAYIEAELKRIGLNPIVDESPVVPGPRSRGITQGRLRNILARVTADASGTQRSPLVAFVSHYDSVPGAPGAADDGAALAVLLDAARVLTTAKRPANDVLFLFTDGEENGIQGASAFVEKHPWAREIALLVNFDARGSSGPPILFETGPASARVVERYFSVAPHRSGSSLFRAIYRVLPNNTDFSAFRALNTPGLNFALVFDWNNYHTARDDLQHLSMESLQQEGENAVRLVTAFGDADLAAIRDDRPQTFFTLPFGIPIRYGRAASQLLAVFALLLSIVAIARSLLHGRIRASRIVRSALATGIAALLSVPTGFLILRIFYGFGAGVVANYRLCTLVALAVAALLLWTAQRLLASRSNAFEVLAGSIIWWMLSTVALSIAAPEGSYFATLACLGGAAALALRTRFAFIVPVTVICLVLAPLTFTLLWGLAGPMAAAALVPGVLSLGLLPLRSNFASGREHIAPADAKATPDVLVR
jgi:hypothetical protein